MGTVTPWEIPGAEGETIFGDCHMPDGDAKGVVLIAHGFKGYKDYGMFPRIAQTMCAAGFIAHRFNFSHSGMTNNIETFERPDLFERDTWNKQVHDYRAVTDAVAGGTIAGQGLRHIMFGHSKGGVSALLTAGRFAHDDSWVKPVGIVTAAAPSECNNLMPEMEEELYEKGFLVSPSARTGQDLHIGRDFLAEQDDDPVGHDLLALVENIVCPILVIHGDDDPTVPHSCAVQIVENAQKAGGLIIEGANHVFNVVNPLADDAPSSPQLQTILDRMTEFANESSS